MTALNQWLLASLPAALVSAFTWGMLSMILSPCHLVSVPLVFGCMMKHRGNTPLEGLPMRIALLFALGMTVSIGIIGLVTHLLGRLAGDVGPLGEGILAVILIAVGLSIAGLFQLPLPGASMNRVGAGAPALVLGLVFGAALGPCTFAFMAPVLAVMFTTESLGFSLALGTAFAVGHAAVVLLMGAFAGRLQRVVEWSGESRLARSLRIVCGTLVALGGAFLLMRVL